MANLAIGLHARGHLVHLFIYHPEYSHVDAEVRAAGVTIVAFRKRWKLDPGLALALVRHARRTGFDVAVAFLATPSLYALIAGLASGIPVVTSERSFMLPGALPLRTRALRQPLRFAAHVTANSHHQRERVVREFPWLAGRCSTIWNGVDTRRFAPTDSARAEGPLRVLGAGTIGPVKQIDVLARALVSLARANAPPVSVSWAGKLLDQGASRAVKETVDALLRQHGLTERWSWLGLQTDVAALLRTHDVLVHPSATEGLPNTLCEGLAGGIPIVASRACDHPRLVGADERGMLFDPGDADSLAAALARLAAMSADERRAMGARARLFAKQELSLEVCIDRYEALLESLPGTRIRETRPTES